MLYLGPDTIFPHSFNYNWSPRYLYNMEGTNWLIQLHLHIIASTGQNAQMWRDNTQVSSTDILIKSHAVRKLASAASVCISGKCPLCVQCSVNELKSFMGTSRQRFTNLDRSCAVPLAPIFSRERSTCNRIKQQWVTGIYKNDCNSVHSDKKKSILNPLRIMLFM